MDDNFNAQPENMERYYNVLGVCINTETYNNKPPTNPFKKIILYYSHTFDCYLNKLVIL